MPLPPPPPPPLPPPHATATCVFRDIQVSHIILQMGTCNIVSKVQYICIYTYIWQHLVHFVHSRLGKAGTCPVVPAVNKIYAHSRSTAIGRSKQQPKCMCAQYFDLYLYTHVLMYILALYRERCIYIYMYRERQRERWTIIAIDIIIIPIIITIRLIMIRGHIIINNTNNKTAS